MNGNEPKQRKTKIDFESVGIHRGDVIKILT